MVEELALSVALLDAALAFAAMRTGQAGARAVDAATMADGLLETMDLTHLEPEGGYGRVLGALAGGLDALLLFSRTGVAAEV